MSSSAPNLLVFMSDQHSPRFLGCYGDPITRTPTLDRLADESVCFDAAYCGNPICVPSRATFMSARHSHHIGVWGNDDALPSHVPTWAHSLGMAGYRTVLCGRMHFVGGDQHHGFLERRVGDVSPAFIGRNAAIERDRGYWGITQARDAAGPGHTSFLAYDRAVAAEASRLIYEHETRGDPRPLCLVVSFICPHDPFIAPPALFEQYRGRIPLPHNHDTRAHPLHPVYAAVQQSQRAADVSQATLDQARAAYAALVSFIDNRIDDVLQAMEASPLGRNLVTAYISDHGELAGEHGLWGKQTFHEASARVPVILHAPGRIPTGQRCDRPVSLLDVGPTLIDLANAPAMPDADGRSLLPLCHDPAAEPDRAVFAEGTITPSRMVRQGPWKYAHYLGHEPELFHLIDDPHETTNLAGQPAHADRVAALEQLLHADGWCAQAVQHARQARQADEAFLAQWAQTTNATDPIQWAPPAPL